MCVSLYTPEAVKWIIKKSHKKSFWWRTNIAFHLLFARRLVRSSDNSMICCGQTELCSSFLCNVWSRPASHEHCSMNISFASEMAKLRKMERKMDYTYWLIIFLQVLMFLDVYNITREHFHQISAKYPKSLLKTVSVRYPDSQQ